MPPPTTTNGVAEPGPGAAPSLPVCRDLVEATFQLVREYSTHAASLPTDEDYQFHCAFRGFAQQMTSNATAMLDIMDTCVQQVPKKRRVQLSEQGPLNDNQRHAAVMETVDSLLENVDHLLDEARGQRMHGDDQLHVAFGSSIGGGVAQSKSDAGRFAMVRPQLSFETPIDNSHAPFQALVYPEGGGAPTLSAPGFHPYADKIETFAFPNGQLLPGEDTPFAPLDSTPLTFVETPEALAAMISVLGQQRQIAVDLEHHDFRSYQGITCLMQISTRTEDYIVDVIRLRSHMHRLNAVFLAPEVLKVFHGAKEDIRWLQKDFSVYVANLFDTGIALQTLHMPHGLAFAVDHFCQVRLDKKYQTADWRVRPIPADMIRYAQQDTHYLLYVYDRLKALLLHAEGRASTGNLLVHVFQESRRLCLTRYEKPAFDPMTTYREAMGKSIGGLSPLQLEVVRVVFNWRDQAARDADESPPAIMHTAAVLQIASKLPTTAKEVLACCSPVSVVVRRDIGAITELVKRALAERGVNLDDSEQAVQAAKAQHQQASAAGGVGMHRAYSAMSGMLPSVAALGVDSVVTDVAPSGAACSISGSIAPSAWFRAMQLHATKLKTMRPTIEVDLPAKATMQRIATQQKQRQTSATERGADGLGGRLGAAGQYTNIVNLAGDGVDQEPLEECVALPRRDEDVAPVAASTNEEEEGCETAAQNGSVGAPSGSVGEVKSLFEEFGSGRSNRRRQQHRRQRDDEDDN